MKERLDSYLKEYDMLTAETRLWLAASDPKLTVAFATCAALAGAGYWQGKYPLILLIPLVVIFLSLILVYQLDNIIRLGAQLTVLEERINALIGDEPTLTYHNHTVVVVFDQPVLRDPVTGRRRLSLNTIYNGIALVVLLAGSILAVVYGWPKIRVEHPVIAWVYAILVGVGTGTVIWLLVRATKSKQWYLNIIRGKADASNRSASLREAFGVDVKVARLHKLMYGLLYPAILGTVLVGILSLISKLIEAEPATRIEFGAGKLILTFGIVIHFIVDYILAQEAPERGWGGFVVDCGVLAGLWVAAASVHAPFTDASAGAAPNVRILCIALAVVYGLFLLYLVFLHKGLQSTRLLATVEVFSLAWFVVGAAWANLSFAALGLFMSAAFLLWAGNKVLPPVRATQGQE
jgi:hypothetical protein